MFSKSPRKDLTQQSPSLGRLQQQGFWSWLGGQPSYSADTVPAKARSALGTTTGLPTNQCLEEPCLQPWHLLPPDLIGLFVHVIPSEYKVRFPPPSFLFSAFFLPHHIFFPLLPPFPSFPSISSSSVPSPPLPSLLLFLPFLFFFLFPMVLFIFLVRNNPAKLHLEEATVLCNYHQTE